MEGRRRQLQLSGKMLRQRDVEPIRGRWTEAERPPSAGVFASEHLRDQNTIVEGDDAVAEVLTLWPHADN